MSAEAVEAVRLGFRIAFSFARIPGMLCNRSTGSVRIRAAGTASNGLNIATLRLTRKERGGDAFMVIELDEAPNEKTRDDIRALPWVRWAYRLDKVSA